MKAPTQSELIEKAVRAASARGSGGDQVSITQARNVIRCYLVELAKLSGWQILKLLGK